MFEAICKKNWLSPLLGVFFVAVGLSGTLMLFHLSPPFLRGMHEWIGLGFVVTGVLHLVLNWKALLRYFETRMAVVSLVIGVLLVGFFVVGGALGGDEHERRPPREKGAAPDHDDDD